MLGSCFDVAIVGAGISGMYAAYCCGISGIKSCVVESLSCVGGQCSIFYPDKYIYGAPGFNDTTKASDFVNMIRKQAYSSDTTEFFNRKIEEISFEDGLFSLKSTDFCDIQAKKVVLAIGVGEMIPNIPVNIKDIETLKDSSFVQYYCMKTDLYSDKTVIIAGGGDSAADFAINIANFAKNVVLIHRRDKLSCDESKISALKQLELSGKLKMILSCNITEICDDKTVKTDLSDMFADYIVFCYGFRTNPGAIKGLKDLGVKTEFGLIKVNIDTMQTDSCGIYAIGDAVSYKNKKKNFVSCFFEADRAIRIIKNTINT